MSRTTTRARVVIGSAVMAVAGFGAVGHLSASPETAPPSTPPGSEPVGSAPAVDAERDALVDSIVASAATAGFPLDRDCVAGLAAQLPDEDVPLVAEQLAGGTAEMPDPVAATLVAETMPADPADTIQPLDTAAVTTAIAESVPMGSEPLMSPAVEELGAQIIYCAAGDADPALVADALAVIEADPEAPSFDLACVESVLSTFDDETLQLIIEDRDAVATESVADVTVSVATVTGDTSGTETDGVASEPAGSDLPEMSMPEMSMPEQGFEEAMLLLACSPEFLDGAGTIDSGSAPPSPDTSATVAVSEPTETTVG